MTIASKRAEPLTNGTLRSFSACGPRLGHGEVFDFLCRDLLCVSAHDQMYFVRCRVDLIEQTLEVNRAAGASRGDDEFITRYRTTGRARTLDRIGSRRVLITGCAARAPTVFGDDRDVHRSSRGSQWSVPSRNQRFPFRVDHRLLRKCAVVPSAEADRDDACGNLPVPIALIMLSPLPVLTRAISAA